MIVLVAFYNCHNLSILWHQTKEKKMSQTNLNALYDCLLNRLLCGYFTGVFLSNSNHWKQEKSSDLIFLKKGDAEHIGNKTLWNSVRIKVYWNCLLPVAKLVHHTKFDTYQ